jgi:peptidoglycan/LPS O-acetylase OafA/YrhL
MNLKPYAKAIVGALGAGLAALGVALADNTVTAGEWVTVAVATVGALGLVYAVPNRPVQ